METTMRGKVEHEITVKEVKWAILTLKGPLRSHYKSKLSMPLPTDSGRSVIEREGQRKTCTKDLNTLGIAFRWGASFFLEEQDGKLCMAIALIRGLILRLPQNDPRRKLCQSFICLFSMDNLNPLSIQASFALGLPECGCHLYCLQTSASSFHFVG
ncbi:unnamed protein product [Prunus brigantina]